MSDFLKEMFGEVIFGYGRADAIADGALVDVTETAKEAGFKVPVAVTAHVWAECVAVPEGCEGVQDEAGRLWDVVWMAMVAARGAGATDRVNVQVLVVKGPGRKPELQNLVLTIGPGDMGEPVMTIMYPEDD